MTVDPLFFPPARSSPVDRGSRQDESRLCDPLDAESARIIEHREADPYHLDAWLRAALVQWGLA